MKNLIKFYCVTTRRFCGGMTVKDSKIMSTGTAPCFQWAAKRGMTFYNFRNFLKQKNDLINIQEIKGD